MNDQKPYKIELKLFPVLIPLINVFNYYLTYSNIVFNWRTLLTFSIDTLEGFAAWLTVHFIILYLDKKIPFSDHTVKRLIIQIVLTVVVGMLVIIGLTIAIHHLVSDKPFPISFFTYDALIISVWFLVFNGIYVSLYFYKEWRISENRRHEENKLKAGGLKVRSGKQNLILAFDEIAGFAVDNDYVLCLTMTGKKFLLDQSMDALEKLLPAIWFFRLNRQSLVHRQLISGFERTENGKLNVILKLITPLTSPINVSRTRSAAFKSWFQPD